MLGSDWSKKISKVDMTLLHLYFSLWIFQPTFVICGVSRFLMTVEASITLQFPYFMAEKWKMRTYQQPFKKALNITEVFRTTATTETQRVRESSYIYIYIYIYIYMVECSPVVREIWVQSQVASYQRLLKWYLIPSCLTLSNIRYVSRVQWNNPGKGVAPSLAPHCSSY